MAADVIDVSQFIIDRLGSCPGRRAGWQGPTPTLMSTDGFEFALYYSQVYAYTKGTPLFEDSFELQGPAHDRRILPKKVYDHIRSKNHRTTFQELSDAQKLSVNAVINVMKGHEQESFERIIVEARAYVTIEDMATRFEGQDSQELLADISASLFYHDAQIAREVETAKISMAVPIYGCAVSVDSLTRK